MRDIPSNIGSPRNVAETSAILLITRLVSRKRERGRRTACEVLYWTALLGPVPLFRHLPPTLTIPFTFRACVHTSVGSMSHAHAYIHTVHLLARGCTLARTYVQYVRWLGVATQRSLTVVGGCASLDQRARAQQQSRLGGGKISFLGRPTRPSSSRRGVALQLRVSRCTLRNTCTRASGGYNQREVQTINSDTNHFYRRLQSLPKSVDYMPFPQPPRVVQHPGCFWARPQFSFLFLQLKLLTVLCVTRYQYNKYTTSTQLLYYFITWKVW